ncbi:hypothetical protein BVI2075_350022 [Burkholderia vietnamiensis]|nr:hypothetical protein BVI2075_350022 [Burkholderia vietnamiensis]
MTVKLAAHRMMQQSRDSDQSHEET